MQLRVYLRIAKALPVPRRYKVLVLFVLGMLTAGALLLASLFLAASGDTLLAPICSLSGLVVAYGMGRLSGPIQFIQDYHR